MHSPSAAGAAVPLQAIKAVITPAGLQRRLHAFTLIAEDLKRLAGEQVQRAEGLEFTAARIGLSRDATDRVIEEARARAILLGDAYYIVDGLAPVEDTIRAILEVS